MTISSKRLRQTALISAKSAGRPRSISWQWHHWLRMVWVVSWVLLNACKTAAPVTDAPRTQTALSMPAEQTMLVHGRVCYSGDSTRVFSDLKVVFISLIGDRIVENSTFTNSKGAYSLAVPKSPLYRVVLVNDGITIESRDVSLHHGRVDSLGVVLNFQLDYDETEAEQQIYQTYFDVNQAVLKPEFLPEVDKFVKRFLKYNSDSLAVIVEAHAEPTEVPDGYAEREQYLVGIGWERARATCAYLEKKGIPGNKLFIISYGAQRPAVPNTTAEYRQLNRRAILKFSRLSFIDKYRSGRFPPGIFGGHVFPYLQSTLPNGNPSGTKPAPTIRKAKN